MSRNNKNARLQKLEEALPKNRSAAAKARRKEGKVNSPGRAAAPQHGKKNAWWQKNGTYAEFVKGGGRKRRSNKEEAGVVTTAVDEDAAASA